MIAQAETSSDDAMLQHKQALPQPRAQAAQLVTDIQIAVNGPGLPFHPQLVTGSRFAV